MPAAFGVPGKQPRSERALVPLRSVVPNLRLAPTSNITAPLTHQLRGDPTPSGAARRVVLPGWRHSQDDGKAMEQSRQHEKQEVDLNPKSPHGRSQMCKGPVGW